ncbi:MAG: hypothetical protein IPI34_06150 [bacterium]|nr:hypothetical protein [bacterium]
MVVRQCCGSVVSGPAGGCARGGPPPAAVHTSTVVAVTRLAAQAAS